MEIMSASVWRVLVLVKDKVLKEPKQHWGCIIDPAEV
jgi:hypothetical protein